MSDWLVAAALFVAAFCCYSHTTTQFVELRDEGHMLALSRGQNEGQVVHRDTNDIYGPGVYAVTAAALRAGDNHVMAVRRLLAAVRATAVAVAYLLARHLVPVPFALLAAVLSLAYWGRMSWNLNVPYASVYTIPLCMVSFLLLVEALRRDSWRWYFATGLVAGSTILFKQSLGILNVYYIAVALWAAAALADTRSDLSPRALWLTTAGAALLAAALSLLPLLRFVHPHDYVVHFAPMHLLLALVAISGIRRGRAPDLGRLVIRKLLPFGAGAAVAPALVAAAYLHWGSLDKLFHNMFVLPTFFQNYYSAVALPPRSLSLTVLAVVATVSAAMLALARRGRLALGAGAVSAAALLAAWIRFGPAGFATWEPSFWAVALDAFGGSHLFALGSIATLAAAPAILSRPAGDEEAAGQAAVLVASILLLQSFAFVVFPSASYNVFLIQGAITPLFAYVSWRWCHAMLGTSFSPARRAMCFALALVLPAWMAGSILVGIASAWTDSDRTPMELDVMQGIALAPSQHRDFHTAEFVELVEYLRKDTSPEARLLLMTNEEMILFASGRRHAVPDYDFYLFISGWGLMDGAKAVPEGTEPIVDQLEREGGDVLVIERTDSSTANVRKYFPDLAAYVDSHFELARTVGGYRVLRRREPGVAVGEGPW